MRKKKLSFRYNGKEFRVRLTDCTVLPQGYPAVAEHIGKFQGTHMVADIGNGTMNIMYIIDKKPIEEKCWTEKLGTNECMIKAMNAVMEDTGAAIEAATVERVLRFGTADIPEKYLAIIRKVAENYAEDIFTALRKYEFNPDLVRLHVVGGGAVILKNFGVYDPERVEITDDICANAKGYEYVVALSRRNGK